MINKNRGGGKPKKYQYILERKKNRLFEEDASVAFFLKRNFLAYMEGDSTQEILCPKQHPVVLIFWEWCQSRANLYSLVCHAVMQQKCVLVMHVTRTEETLFGIGVKSATVSARNWYIMRVSGKRMLSPADFLEFFVYFF